jgi:carbonic anhydrase/acetyltransferase-like protein (isoleucine patch superfamily)
MGAIVLDGVKIGTGSVIAAGALLTSGMIVPPESVVMGAPAQVKRKTGDRERELIRRSWTHYADMAAEYREAGLVRKTKVKGFLG